MRSFYPRGVINSDFATTVTDRIELKRGECNKSDQKFKNVKKRKGVAKNKLLQRTTKVLDFKEGILVQSSEKSKEEKTQYLISRYADRHGGFFAISVLSCVSCMNARVVCKYDLLKNERRKGVQGTTKNP